MKIAIIAAVAENGVIGRAGGLPWRLAADLQRFKSLTMGRPIVMGRRTWESIGRPLPGRPSIVVTRNESYQTGDPAVETAADLPAAIDLAANKPGGQDAVFIIGGASLYNEALALADELHLTRVQAEVEGDVKFPPFNLDQWELTDAEQRAADERNEFPVIFQRYERVQS